MNWYVSGNSFIWGKNRIGKFFSKTKYAAVQVSGNKYLFHKLPVVLLLFSFWFFLNFWVEGWKQVPCSSLLSKEINQASIPSASPECLLVSTLLKESETWCLSYCSYRQTLGSFPIAFLSFHCCGEPQFPPGCTGPGRSKGSMVWPFKGPGTIRWPPALTWLPWGSSAGKIIGLGGKDVTPGPQAMAAALPPPSYVIHFWLAHTSPPLLPIPLFATV